MNEIFLNPEFWNKVATSKGAEGPITDEDQEQILHAFLSTLKEAGACPFQVIGFLQGVAELFSEQKQAAGATVGDMASGAWNTLTHPGSWSMDPSKMKDTFVTNVADHHLTTAHPQISGILDNVFNGNHAQSVQTAMDFNKGDYAGAMGKVWDGITAHPLVQKWAPAVVPGLATMAAGKMMGLGWGASAALGAGAGYLGMHPGMLSGLGAPGAPGTPAPVPPGSARAHNDINTGGNPPYPATTPPPAGTPPPAPAPATPPAATAMDQNGANAQRIGANVGQVIGAGVQKGGSQQFAQTISPQQLGTLVGAVPGVIGGGLLGAAIPSRDESGETHRGRNALIGATLGGAAGGALGNQAGIVMDEATRPPSLSEMLLAPRRGVIERLYKPPSLREMVTGG